MLSAIWRLIDETRKRMSAGTSLTSKNFSASRMYSRAQSSRPIVSADVPGCREIVREEVTGLLVPPGNAGALADALGRLARDPGLRRRLGAAARDLVERELSEEGVVAQTLALYRLLVPGAG